MNGDRLENLDKLHTTELGRQRIKKNVGLTDEDALLWCKEKLMKETAATRKKGKNYYVEVDGYEITVNASSYTIITVHKMKKVAFYDSRAIQEALKFYKIDDEDYCDKCLACVRHINENPELRTKLEFLYKTLYLDPDIDLAKYWSKDNPEKLFEMETPDFITSIVVLMGYKIHIQNMKKFKLDGSQKHVHKRRVKEALTKDIYERKCNEIRTSQMLWAIYFINLRLVEVEDFQYENMKPKKDEMIQIHIPSGSDIGRESVIHSVNSSKSEVAKYFKKDNPRYGCNSWLLSNQIREMVRDDSKIADFHGLFRVTDGNDCIKDILDFVYKIEECDDYSQLPENTSLEKSIKRFLLKGKKIYLGIGVWKANSNS